MRTGCADDATPGRSASTRVRAPGPAKPPPLPSQTTVERGTRPLTASVVICAYIEARWDQLAAAVLSVQRQSVAAREIIVVVDHNQRLLERVRRELSGVVAVGSDGLPGVSAARNTGVGVSTGDVVAFLDDDADAADDWIERLIADYDQPNIIGVGGTLEPVWPSRRPDWFPVEFHWVVGCSYPGLPPRRGSVRNLFASNMSVRRDLLIELGGFRTDFGRQGDQAEPEETELCIRALQRWPAGAWVYEPRARVQHHIPVERTVLTHFLRRCHAEGLGKARLVELVGPRDGLAVERAYIRYTLPRGLLSGLGDVLRADPKGLFRAAAIVGGFACAAFGYGTARIVRRRPVVARPRGGTR